VSLYPDPGAGTTLVHGPADPASHPSDRLREAFIVGPFEVASRRPPPPDDLDGPERWPIGGS
jgi:hypothetical protein